MLMSKLFRSSGITVLYYWSYSFFRFYVMPSLDLLSRHPILTMIHTLISKYDNDALNVTDKCQNRVQQQQSGQTKQRAAKADETDCSVTLRRQYYAKQCVGGVWPLIHADGSSEGIPLSDQGGLGRGFGAAVWIGTVVVTHGLDVTAAAHATAGNLTAAVCAAVSAPPVFWGNLRHNRIHLKINNSPSKILTIRQLWVASCE